MDATAPEVIISKPRFTLRLVILIVALLILGGVGGYFLSRYYTFLPISSPTSPTTPQAEEKPILQTSPLFGKQTALARGIIVSKDANKITVKGGNGQTDTFELREPVVVYNQASSSVRPGSIELNKPAVITLELKDNKYKVISISYFIPPPPPGS